MSVDTTISHFRNDGFGVFGVQQNKLGHLFEDTAQVRRLVGLKKNDLDMKDKSAVYAMRMLEKGNQVYGKNPHQTRSRSHIGHNGRKQAQMLASSLRQFSRESNNSFYKELVTSEQDTEAEFNNMGSISQRRYSSSSHSPPYKLHTEDNFD